MNKLPASASVATHADGGKLFAPSAARNLPVIVDLLRSVAPRKGRALEIASGTGQHVVAFAGAMPQVDWQPTELTQDRLESIEAYRREAGLHNVRAPVYLDATAQGWSTSHAPVNLVYLGNLLHLINEPQAQAILIESSRALVEGGKLVIYGPFTRAGRLTSDGDAKFDTELRAANPQIGYKDDQWVTDLLTSCGLALSIRNMPSNNLAFIAERSLP